MDNTFTGTPFGGRVAVCSDNSFQLMFIKPGWVGPDFWRQGLNQVAALNDVVHLDYAQDGAGADPAMFFTFAH